MVDDSSNRSSGNDEGSQPSGDAASKNHDAARLDSDAILGLLEARLELLDLSQREAVRSGGVPASRSRGSASDNADGTSSRDSMEMTPTPMVVASASEGTLVTRQARARDAPAAVERAKRSLSTKAQDVPARSEPVSSVATASGAGSLGGVDAKKPPFEQEGADTSWPERPAYHPPRIPPSSIAPSPVASSFSVAPQYDPKAPTRPRARRNSSVPPPALFFGLDRMLVWGLVLGGLFVAVIVVIVHQLALTSAQRPEHSVTERDRETLANEDPHSATQQVGSAVVADNVFESGRTAASGEEAAEQERGSVIGPERGGLRLASDDAGVLPNSAVTQDSASAESVQASEKARLSGVGGGKATPSSLPRPIRAGSSPKKIWIE